MIAVDTNILVYAHREDASWHESAYARVVELAEGRSPWAIPWPCIHEFLSIVTHPRIFAPPTPMPAAIDQVEVWCEAPTLALLGESGNHWAELRRLLKQEGSWPSRTTPVLRRFASTRVRSSGQRIVTSAAIRL